MSNHPAIYWLAGATGLVVLSGIFVLYQNPLLEVYLSSWTLC
ncbi:hypothetical protein QTO30_12480 [Yoonia sp. GPGPB17]